MFEHYSRKAEKYTSKLQGTKDSNKRRIYEDKINYYRQNLQNGVKHQGGAKEELETNIILPPNVELQKPTDLYGEYKLDIEANPIKAIGYGTDHKDKKLRLMQFDRRAPRDTDVVIKIAFCGVCHSDWHTVLDEWRNAKYPIVVGHEITGTVIKAGAAVKKFKVGDKVAVGPNYDSCRSCDLCKKGIEQYCLNGVTEVYNMADRMYAGQIKANGPVTQGGYANVITVDEHFVLALKDAPLDKAAPLLCAGITMYTPLKQFVGLKKAIEAKEGKSFRVGIAGVGGLGSMGIQIAKALDFEVFGLTCTPEKETNTNLGQDGMILMKDINVHEKKKAYFNTFDLIIDTIPFAHNIMPYIQLLKPESTLWVVGSFQDQTLPHNELNRMGRIIRGSSTGNIADTQEFIDFCIEKNIYPNIEKINIQDINETHKKLVLSQVKYRFVIDMSSLSA
jgi:uncharacterized zinc-type alcohol dehydrogenase-like protein